MAYNVIFCRFTEYEQISITAEKQNGCDTHNQNPLLKPSNADLPQQILKCVNKRHRKSRMYYIIYVGELLDRHVKTSRLKCKCGQWPGGIYLTNMYIFSNF